MIFLIFAIKELEMINMHAVHDATMRRSLDESRLARRDMARTTNAASAMVSTNNNRAGHVKFDSSSNALNMREFDNRVKDSMKELDSKVTSLRQLFRAGDPLKERHDAAIKIAAIIRGWLARVRLAKYRQGVRDWTWSRCRQVVWLLEILLGDQSDLDSG